MKRRVSFLLFTLLVLTFANAADPPVRYYTVPIGQLELLEGALPSKEVLDELYYSVHVPTYSDKERMFGKSCFAMRLDGGGEVEFIVQGDLSQRSWDNAFLAIKSKQAGRITGSCDYLLSKNPDKR